MRARARLRRQLLSKDLGLGALQRMMDTLQHQFAEDSEKPAELGDDLKAVGVRYRKFRKLSRRMVVEAKDRRTCAHLGSVMFARSLHLSRDLPNSGGHGLNTIRHDAPRRED